MPVHSRASCTRGEKAVRDLDFAVNAAAIRGG